MQSKTIAGAWRRAFGNVAPVGHLCRIALADRWLRIHSLPGAKRYPEDPAEYAELLLRHNAVATSLLGSDADCILFFCDFPSEPATALLGLLPAASRVPYYLPELARLTNEYEQLRIGATCVAWHSGSFDEILRARTDDRIGPTLFANLDRGTAFAPYDGGADLFFASREQVAESRVLWGSWLSPRNDGL